MKKRSEPQYRLAFAAGVLAWLVPGAGHLLLRRPVRAVILFVCIVGLFWTGVALGGTFTADPVKERAWFVGQMATGSSGMAAWYIQGAAREKIINRLLEERKIPRSFPTGQDGEQWWNAFNQAAAEEGLALVYPTDTAARAYTGVAGMLNLLCIFDAIMLGLLGQLGEPPPLPPEEKKERLAGREATA